MTAIATSLAEAKRQAAQRAATARLRQFLLLLAREKLPTPVLEHRFHSVRRWRLDIAWPAQLLALEVDGGIWMKAEDGKGAHSRPANIERDQEKGNNAVILGWRILRVQPQALATWTTVDLVRKALTTTKGTTQ